MARIQKQYSVYRITLPSGNQYVGYTSMTINERLKNHLYRAKEGVAAKHPFYSELKGLKKEDCHVEVIAVYTDRYKAMEAERHYIALVPKDKSLNLSEGGLSDASFGGKIFWQRLNENPEERETYLKKLSDRKKKDDWTDYNILTAKAEEWRHAHPHEAYKMSYRAQRIARKKSDCAVKTPVTETQAEMKERLMHKYKLNQVKQKYVTAAWDRRSPKERQEIGRKISESLKRHQESLSEEQRRKETEKARASIDRSIQGPAASRGIKRFWEELRKDPERYREYIERRKATLRETNKKKRENK